MHVQSICTATDRYAARTAQKRGGVPTTAFFSSSAAQFRLQPRNLTHSRLLAHALLQAGVIAFSDVFSCAWSP